jgi:IS30 family transposase
VAVLQLLWRERAVPVKLSSGTALNFEWAAKQSFSQVPPNYRKTLTLDNGSEMSNYEEIEQQNQL